MALSLWNLFEAIVLCLNAICVLHEERFLAKIGWTSQSRLQGFGEPPTAGSQIMNLFHSIRTVMRIPLIFVNTIVILMKLFNISSPNIHKSAKIASKVRTTAKMVKQFIDIGANLTDPMFQGFYGSKSYHEPDLEHVLNRSWSQGLQKIIVTGGSLEDSKKALDLVSERDKLFSTVGCHPTRCNEFESDSNPDEYYDGLKKLIEGNKGKVVAVGEIGLDYDRLHFCDKDVQKKYFRKQLNLSMETRLPLFLHCRNAAEDFLQIISEFPDLPGGVVHSFDGTKEEAKQILDKGFYIGINGCSLKTEANLEVVKEIPENRLMIETDCPWCGVRPTHAGFKYVLTKFKTVKKNKKVDLPFGTYSIDGRNEPAMISQVLEILSAVKNIDPDILCDQIYKNTVKLFF